MTGRSIADELVYSVNIGAIERLNSSVIPHPNKDHPPTRVCEGDHLTCERNRIGRISLKLMSTVLSAPDNFKKFYCFQIS
jgi:hypothetical protein